MSAAIHLVAFQDRLANFIFVAVPDERGRYLRTDRSVALVRCNHCNAVVGEPCKSKTGDGYSGTTHVARRILARRLFGHGLNADDVLSRSLAITPDADMEAAA